MYLHLSYTGICQGRGHSNQGNCSNDCVWNENGGIYMCMYIHGNICV